MGLNRYSEGNRSLILKLIETGVASEDLLREKWAGFFSKLESGLSFHKLCLMLQAYCLIFPLKESELMKEDSSNENDLSSDLNKKRKTSFLVPSMLPEIPAEEEIDCDVPWVKFFFDFKKFLPEAIYHRLICIMLVDTEDPSSEDAMPKFSKLWSCFYDIDESHWRFDYLQGDHKLKVSIQ